MRQPDKNKIRHLSKFSQLILLNDEAHIISSCNSIFSTKNLQNTPATTWFPFLESIFDYLLQLQPESPEVKFSKIETPIRLLPGIYDFTFSKVLIDGKPLLLWTIYDYTNLYEDFKHYQQRKNEYEILREILELRHKNLRSVEDISSERNITLEDFNHIQLHYFNNLKSALQSPANALDGFTLLLSGSLEKDKTSYLQALKNSISEIQQVIETLEDLPGTSTQVKPFGNQPNYVNPQDVLIHVISWIRERFDFPVSIRFDVGQEVPKGIYCDEMALNQILFGLLSNILRIHPASHLQISLKTTSVKKSSVRLRFQITETLVREHTSSIQGDLNNFVLSLSVVKQLIDRQKGNIVVEKDPESLGISISCELEFAF